MKKKLLIAAVSAMSVFALAACSSNTNEDIATMKGGKITVEDFYNEAKHESSNQQIVRNMILFKVFGEKYGDKVDEKELDKKYNEQKEALGDAFETQLEAAGYTKKTFKEYLKNSMALQEGLKAHVKLTDADLKTAWDAFHPEVEAQLIKLTDEETAKKIQAEAAAKDADFTAIAKKNSTDTETKEDGGKVKFDSTSSTVPAEVQEAAFKLKDGEVSDVITATDASTYQSSYYVVKMVKNKAKGNSMKPYEKQIKEIATQAKINDSTFSTKVIGEELKDANVKIKDNTFDNILTDFIQAAETKESSTKESETKESETKESEKATDSSTKTTEESTEASTAESK